MNWSGSNKHVMVKIIDFLVVCFSRVIFVTDANPILQNEDILILPMDILEIENHKIKLNEVLHHFGNVKTNKIICISNKFLNIKLDILVNNAGRSQRASWEEVNSTVDRQLFELNVFSMVALSRVVLAYFAERSPKMDGQIVVTSSLAGLVGFPFSPSYTGSKHALQVINGITVKFSANNRSLS